MAIEEVVVKGTLKIKKGDIFKKKKKKTVDPKMIDLTIKKDEQSGTVGKTKAEIAFEKRRQETMATTSHNYHCDRMYLRHSLILLHDFGWNAKEAHRKLVDTYGEDVISYMTCKNWFAKFKKGDFSLEDAPKSGRPMELDLEVLRSTVEKDPHLTTREIATMLGCNHSTIARGLEKLGMVAGTLLRHLQKSWRKKYTHRPNFERMQKKASVSHRQRVEEFNKQMSELTEFNDIPKVSWTK